MPITPEQARAELARRELRRRGVGLDLPDPSEDMLAKARRALTPETPETPGTWRGEAYRAVGRGGIKAMAAGPGTLASLMEAGGKMPGKWYPETPAVEQYNKKTIQRLRKKAQDIYRTADVPSLQPRKKGVGGFLVNVAGETVPAMTAAIGATVLVGPAGAIAVGTATGGEMVYQEALKGGATAEQAEVERWIAGPIMGMLERVQADEVLKLDKSLIPALIEAARKKAIGKLAKTGGAIAERQAIGAAVEGVTEALQQETQIEVARLHGQKLTPKEYLKQLGTAFAGGAAVGGPAKALTSAKRGLAELGPEIRKAELTSLVDRVATQEKTIPLEAVEIAKEKIEAGEYDAPVNTEVAAPAGGELLPRYRKLHELARDLETERDATAQQLDEHLARSEPDPTISVRLAKDLQTAEKQAAGARAEAEKIGDSWERAQTVDTSRQVPTKGEAGGKPPEQPPAPPSTETPIPGDKGRKYKQGPSIRRAFVDYEASRIGAETYQGSPTEEKAMWRQKAIDQGIPAIVDQMAIDLIREPRPLTDVEIAGFDIRRQQLADQYDAADKILSNAAPGSPEAKQAAASLKDAQNLYGKLGEAAGLTGAEWGRQGVSMQGQRKIIHDPTNVLSMLTEAAATKGDKLTPDETGQVKQKVRAVKQATEKANVVRRAERRKQAQRSTRLGKRRYKGMTEAEKDAEIQDILSREGGPDDAGIKRIVENLASRPDAKDFESVVKRMQTLLPDVTMESVEDSIANAIQRKVRMTDILVETINEIASRQPRRNKKLRTDAADFRYYIERKEAKEPNHRVPRTEAEATQKLIEFRDQVKAEYEASDARQKQKLEKTLAFLNARIANGDYGPRTRAEKPLRSEELEKLDYQVYRARQELKQRIANLDPWWTDWRQVVTKPFREIQAWKSASDFSALMRQGGIALRSHPIRTLRRVPGAVEAIFNPEKAWKINEELVNGERSWYYHRAGLEFTAVDGPMLGREELFAASLVERIPYLGQLVKGSNRGFVTLLNTIRADSFDAMTRSFRGPGGLSLAESQAVANYVNVMTGRGSVAGLEKHVHTLNGLLWSPRFTLSRIQFRLGMPIGQAPTWRIRKAITIEYARYLVGVATTMWLYEHVFGGEVEHDNRSSDYGKIVVGNTRLDPLSGLSQFTVLMRRMISGEKMNQAGQVIPIAGSDVPYRGDTRFSTIQRFGRSKLGFLPGLVWDVLEGKDFTGEPISAKKELLMAPVPLGFEGIVNLMQDQGVPKGTALGVLNLLGEGVQTYEPKQTGGPRRRVAQRRQVRRKQ